MRSWMGNVARTIPAKFATQTVTVEATTSPPATGFLVGGRRVGFGDQVRIPLVDALTLEKVGKARILPDSEKVELL